MFNTTAQVWAHAKPRLIGVWSRVEVVHPEGFPDLMGFWRGQVRFIEIKANGDSMRQSQQLWIGDALAAGIDVRILKAKGSRLAWFQDILCAKEVAPPLYWRPALKQISGL